MLPFLAVTKKMIVDMFRHVLDVNLIGNFDVMKSFESALIASKGSIINIASMYSFLAVQGCQLTEQAKRQFTN